MSVVKSETIVCPICGGEAKIDHLEERVAMYTGEMYDETEPMIETVVLTGRGMYCTNPDCEFCDYDPPTY